MGHPFFSFIIPVYNVEQYLEECVDSILRRYDDDYEIILVDDGSTDNSGKICDDYAFNNSNVYVIHKENGGLSDARNKGIEKSTGEYILFVDSDDYVDSNAISELKLTIEKNGYPDVVFFEAIKFYPSGLIEPMSDGYTHEGIDGKTRDEVLYFLQSMPKYPGSACTKAVRRTLISRDLMFETGLISEDNEWTLRLFGKACSYAYCDSKCYYYRQSRDKSITRSPTIRTIKSLLSIIERHSYIVPSSCYEKFCNASCAYLMVVLLFNLQQLSAEKLLKKELYKEAKRYSWVMKYATTKKTKLVAISCRIFGLRLTGKSLSLYRKIKQKNRNK